MDIQQVVAFAGVITAVATAWAVIRKFFVTVDCIIEGIRCQLRTDMLRVYYRNREHKEIRQYEKENFEKNYAAYKALYGNSFVDDIHSEVRHWEVIS